MCFQGLCSIASLQHYMSQDPGISPLVMGPLQLPQGSPSTFFEAVVMVPGTLTVLLVMDRKVCDGHTLLKPNADMP